MAAALNATPQKGMSRIDVLTLLSRKLIYTIQLDLELQALPIDGLINPITSDEILNKINKSSAMPNHIKRSIKRIGRHLGLISPKFLCICGEGDFENSEKLNFHMLSAHHVDAFNMSH